MQFSTESVLSSPRHGLLHHLLYGLKTPDTKCIGELATLGYLVTHQNELWHHCTHTELLYQYHNQRIIETRGGWYTINNFILNSFSIANYVLDMTALTGNCAINKV